MTSKLRTIILSALRRVWYLSAERAEFFKDAGERNGWSVIYRCHYCKKEFSRKEVQCDHKVPVVDPVMGFEGFDIYISRLFCDPSNLVLACLNCHSKKSNKENVVRKKRRLTNK